MLIPEGHQKDLSLMKIVLFMETNCFLSRKDFINLRVWPHMPQ